MEFNVWALKSKSTGKFRVDFFDNRRVWPKMYWTREAARSAKSKNDVIVKMNVNMKELINGN